jgi:hypothetical protein
MERVLVVFDKLSEIDKTNLSSVGMAVYAILVNEHDAREFDGYEQFNFELFITDTMVML